MVHSLKTKQPYFNDIASGKKTFEIRKNDRDFQVGDFLALNEWDVRFENSTDKELTESYTGRFIFAQITYVLDNPNYCKEGYVALGIDCTAIMTHGWMHQPPEKVKNGVGFPIYDRGVDK